MTTLTVVKPEENDPYIEIKMPAGGENNVWRFDLNTQTLHGPREPLEFSDTESIKLYRPNEANTEISAQRLAILSGKDNADGVVPSPEMVQGLIDGTPEFLAENDGTVFTLNAEAEAPAAAVSENKIADLIATLPEDSTPEDRQPIFEQITAIREQGYVPTEADKAAATRLAMEIKGEIEGFEAQIEEIDAEIAEIEAREQARAETPAEAVVDNKSFTADLDNGDGTILIIDFGPDVDKLDPMFQDINMKEMDPTNVDKVLGAIHDKAMAGDIFSADDIAAIDALIENLEFSQGQGLRFWDDEGLEGVRQAFERIRDIVAKTVAAVAAPAALTVEEAEPQQVRIDPTVLEDPQTQAPQQTASTGLLAREAEIDGARDFLRDLDPEQVAAFQKMLKDVAVSEDNPVLDPGVIDGKLGLKTMAAWDEYVAANGLDPNMTFEEACVLLSNPPEAGFSLSETAEKVTSFAVEVGGQLPPAQLVQGAVEVARSVAPDVQAFMADVMEKGREAQAQQELASDKDADVVASVGPAIVT